MQSGRLGCVIPYALVASPYCWARPLMYRADELPTMLSYSWFSLTITKTWSKLGVCERATDGSPSKLWSCRA